MNHSHAAAAFGNIYLRLTFQGDIPESLMTSLSAKVTSAPGKSGLFGVTERSHEIRFSSGLYSNLEV